MTDMEKCKEVLNRMRDKIEGLCCDYDDHLESQQKALETIHGELRAYTMDAADQINLLQPDLEYINAYVRVSKELREVYQARISLCTTQYTGSKARFADGILDDRDDDAEMY